MAIMLLTLKKRFFTPPPLILRRALAMPNLCACDGIWCLPYPIWNWLYCWSVWLTFLNYVNQYTKPFNDISSVLAELQSALACAERLYSILDQEEVKESGKRELARRRCRRSCPI